MKDDQENQNNKINKIFSTGGYMSLPIILAAKLLKLDIYLIEPKGPDLLWANV